MEESYAPSSIEPTLKYKRRALKATGLPLLALSFQTLGIIYSDIGTSPLYTLNGIWPPSGPIPSEEDVIGGVSAIIWSLSLLPLFKYVIMSLFFGTKEGEGGSFALYQGLYPRADADFDADRTLTGDSTFNKDTPSKRSFKDRIRWPSLLCALFGTSLTMADGMLTPAVSVTSAVSGIGVAKPAISDKVTGVSIAFLFALFFVQQFGTASLAFTFAPIGFIWFLTLAGTGIYNITFFPGIFRAFDPSRAVLLFVRTRNYDLLAGVLLAITGCEAVFANLGQFNVASIRISFIGFVYPSLVLAYLGQGARLIDNPEQVLPQIFYNTIPGEVGGSLYWFVFTFAVAATLVASQAMITATFSLVQQVINSKAFFPLRMLHTSDKVQGQVYIPGVNWTLMIATIILVAVFKNLTNLGLAYGFAVATVMIVSTVLISIQIRHVKKLPIICGVLFFLFFGFFDGLFWGAALKKVPHGAWVTLMIGIILLLPMTLWVWAKSLEDNFDGQNRMNLRHFIYQEKGGHASGVDDDGDSSDITDDTANQSFYMLSNSNGLEKSGTVPPASTERKELQRIPTCAIFHKVASGKGVPHTFVGFIRQWPALPRIVIFLSVSLVSTPHVHAEDRYVVTKVRTIDGFYGVTYYIGFRDDFDVKSADLIEKICTIERQMNPRIPESQIREIRALGQTATHIAPHYHVVSKRIQGGYIAAVANYFRSFLIEAVYRRLATMFPETANWLTSADEIIHVGINAEI
ncbi:potassium transporter [Panaeolus papilionaceus]|nr:potassium transporter [Panaeolus papilionaceus]